jgi:hypothetical protein
VAALDQLHTVLSSTFATNLTSGLPSSQTFDVVSVQEDLHLGQRVTSYAIDTWNGSTWT